MRWHFTLALIILPTLFVNPLVAQNNSISPQIQSSHKSLSDSQVLDRYKQILTEDDSNDLMDDYSVYYEEFLEDLNLKAKKLVIEIYNENQSNFESLEDSAKAQVYNAIFFAAASISKPEIYGGIEAKDKLNEAMFLKWLTIKVWWKLSQLKSFFEQHWEKFEQLAKNNSAELKKRLAVVDKRLANAQNRLASAKEKSLKLDSDIWKLDSDIWKLDANIVLLKQLQLLLN